jgi:hypothetical protein
MLTAHEPIAGRAVLPRRRIDGSPAARQRSPTVGFMKIRHTWSSRSAADEVVRTPNSDLTKTEESGQGP